MSDRPAWVDDELFPWAWPITGLHIQALSHLLGSPLGRLLIGRLNLFATPTRREASSARGRWTCTAAIRGCTSFVAE